MNLSAFYLYSIRFLRNLIVIFGILVATLVLQPVYVHAQDELNEPILSRDSVPNPSTVWKKSALLPGWGQVTNKQPWKIPIIYASLAGLGYYSIAQHNEYNDYKAAFYNSVVTNTDQKFGPTRADLDGLPPELLRYNRNTFRNRRDIGILMVVAAWGLNVVDAYVFAQLRDFDTGPDLTFVPRRNDLHGINEAQYSMDVILSIPLNKK